MIYTAYLAVMVVVGVAYIPLYLRALSILKARHRHEFERLGSPSLVMNNSLGNTLAFQRFLFTRKYRELNDTELEKILDICRVTGFVSYSATTLMVLAAVATGG